MDMIIDVNSDEFEDMKDLRSLCRAMCSNVKELNEEKKDEEITKMTDRLMKDLRQLELKQYDLTYAEVEQVTANLNSIFKVMESTYERLKAEQRIKYGQ